MDKFNSPVSRLLHWADVKPDVVYLTQPIARDVVQYSWNRVLQEVSVMAQYLEKYDKGSHIAIFSLNCAHWIMADLAIQMAGHVSIPIYPTASQTTVEKILDHSETSAIFIGKMFEPAELDFLPDHIEQIAIYQSRESMPFFDDLVAQGQAINQIHQPGADDLMSIVYTSGTTGDPKGVMVSYRAINAAIDLVKSIVVINQQDRFVSYLPLAHVAERMSVEFGALYHGCHVAFIRSLETFTLDVKKARPTIFFGVPRIWTKIKSSIEDKLGGSERVKRILNMPVIGTLFKKLLIRKLGFQQVRFALCAAAAVNLDVLTWFKQLGLKLNEAYGMSETCGLSHMVKQDQECTGSVGKIIDGCEFKLSEEDEILLRNPAMMDGYYKQEELTANTIDADGWLHTGDLGKVDGEGYLYITGRIKDIFKTSKGKYIAPDPIEKIFQSKLETEHVLLMGDGFSQPFLVVSIAESPHANDLHSFLQLCERSLKSINVQLEKHERLSHVFISDQALTTENGLLTPTLKLKRNSIERLYHLEAESLMDQSDEKVMQISLNY
ncbi:MAG: AMP-binding protein [Marinicella sp.]